MKDPKGMAALLVGKMPKPAAEGEGDEYDGKTACVEDMMTALDSKDAKAFAAALDAYLDHR